MFRKLSRFWLDPLALGTRWLRKPRRLQNAPRLVMNHLGTAELLEDRTLLSAELGFALAMELSADSVGDLVTVDGLGNVYNASRFTGTARVRSVSAASGVAPATFTSAGGYDILITKYASDGGLVWARQLGTPSNDSPLAGLSVDSSGNIYVAGDFTGTLTAGDMTLNSNGNTDAFVLKLDVAGQPVWGANFGSVGVDRGTSLAVDAAGNIVIGGSFTGTVDFAPGDLISPASSTANSNSAFLLRLNTLGEFRSVQTLGGGVNQINIEDLELDSSGTIYLGGTFTGTPDFNPGAGMLPIASRGLSDVYLARFDPNGNLEWAKGYGNSMADSFAGLAVSSFGRVYYAASVVANPGNGSTEILFPTASGSNYSVSPPGGGATNAYVVEFDLTGNVQRVAQFGGMDIARAEGLAVDAMGAIYIAGSFNGSIDAVPYSLKAILVSVGSTDMFIAKLLPSTLEVAWVSQLGGDQSDISVDIALGFEGDIYLTGSFSGAADVDPTAVRRNLTATGARNSFLTQMSQDPSGAAAALDVTFGDRGFITESPFVESTDDAAYLTVMQGNKILVAGLTLNDKNAPRKIALTRLNPDGSVDNSFGTAGRSFFAFGDGTSYLGGLRLLADGKILVFGTVVFNRSGPDLGPIALARLSADGNLDNTFGTGGIQVVAGPAIKSYAGVLQNIGGEQRLLLGGQADDKRFLVRLTSSGSIDTTFVPPVFSGSNESIQSLALQGNAILVGGSNGYLVRLLQNGAIDSSFTSSFVSPASPGAISSKTTITSIAIAPSGIIAVGAAIIEVNKSFVREQAGVVEFFNANGTPYLSYPNQGLISVRDQVDSLAIASSGAIYVQGSQVTVKGKNIGPGGFAFSKTFSRSIAVISGGVVDTHFGSSGYVTVSNDGVESVNNSNPEPIYARPVLMAIDAAGRLLLPSAKSRDFTLARFLPDGTYDTSFGDEGVSRIAFEPQFGKGDLVALASAIDDHGRYLVVSILTVNGESRGMLTRFLTDGTVDIEFAQRGNLVFGVNEILTTIKIAANGDIVVAGYAPFSEAIADPRPYPNAPQTYHYVQHGVALFIQKWNASGTTLVNSFHGILPVTERGIWISGLDIDRQGRVVVTGTYDGYDATKFGYHQSMFVMRLESYSNYFAVDSSFGSKGYILPNYHTASQGNAVVVLPSDAVLVGGTSYNGSVLKDDFMLWQFDSHGVADKSFNGNGIVSVDMGWNERLRNLSVTPSGLIVAAGSNDRATTSAAIAVFHSDGKQYRSFNGTGSMVITPNEPEYLAGARATPDGKIVVWGTGPSGFEVGRMNTYGIWDSTFSNTSGMVTVPALLSSFGTSSSSRTVLADVAIADDGQIYAAGTVIYDSLVYPYTHRTQLGLFRLNGINDPISITLSNTVVQENSAVGTLVGIMDTNGVDHGNNRWLGLIDDAGGRFRQYGNRVEVANPSLLNFEVGAQYVIKLQFTDRAGQIYTAAFRIQVKNVNEAPTAIALSQNSISEQMPVGSLVGRLTSTDPEAGGAFSYVLATGNGDTDNSRFTIDANGNLRSAEVFDFETRDSYSVRVRTTDAGGLWVEQTLTVRVTYVDSIPPMISKTTAALGNGTLYAGTTALDIVFSEAVTQANQAANFDLRSAGADGLLGTADDVVVTLAAAYEAGKSKLTFPALVSGVYRLTVKDTIRDTWNNTLDGNADGVAGADYRNDFVVLPRATASLTTPGSSVGVGDGSPNAAVSGDFNLDGLEDIAIATAASNTISVLLGNGAGGFSLAGTPVATSGELAYSIVTGLFNGDLYPDLAVTGFNSGKISVLTGDGAGGFGLASTITLASNLWTLTTGYFNNDSKLDLAAVTLSGNLYVLQGNGAAGFTLIGSAIGTGGVGSRAIVAGLLDDDSYLDLAIAQSNSNTVSIMKGAGDGSFTLLGTPISTGGTNAYSLTLGFINSDSKPDLAVVNAISNTVSVLLGNGAGSFTAVGAPLSVGVYPVSVVIENADRDSFADLVVANYRGNNVSVLLGNGNGTFSSAVNSANVGTNPRTVVVSDFDLSRPGLEIAAINYTSSDLRLLGVEGIPASFQLQGPQAEFSVATTGPSAGQLVQTSSNGADGLNRLRINGADFTPTGVSTLIDEGRTVATPTATLSGLQVSRETTVPSGGTIDFARTVDTFQNSTGAPITVNVQYLGNVGSDGATTVFGTFDGDTTVNSADQWFGTDDADGNGAPAVIHYVHGRGGLAPTSVSTLGDNVQWTYSLTVQPGETLRLATFTIIANSRALAIAGANQLVSPIRLSEVARAFLTMGEETSLANFVLNVAPTDITLSGVSVNENLPVGTAVGQLSAVDPDPQNAFVYTLVTGSGDTDNDRFTIDVNGIVRTNRIFDSEEQGQRTIRVRATDQGGLWTEKSLTITITDVFEPPVDVEPNDTRETALVLAAGTVANAFIGNGPAGAADVDMFRITLSANQLVSFNGYSYPAHNYSNFTDLHLYDAGGHDLSGYLTYWGGFYSTTGGTYYVAVTGPVTPYEFGYTVQTLTGITEVEPNDTVATAQPVSVTLGSTSTRQGFWGERSEIGDPDIYAVFVPANTILEVSIQGVPGFITSSSSKLAALDADGNVLVTNPAYYLPLTYYSFADETIYVRFNERADLKQAYQIQFTLTSIDSAILDVESNDTPETALELAPGTVANGFIGNGAAGLADVDMFRVTLGAHQLVSFSGYSYPAHNYSNFTDLRLYDADGQDLTGYLTYWGGYYSETGGTYYAAVTGPFSAYTFSYGLQTLTGITEVEPNDTVATAQPVSVTLGSTSTRQGFWGERSEIGDPDIYAVFVPANTILEVSIQGVPGFITSSSSKLAALDADGNVLVTNPAYYLPLTYYSFADETIYVRFNERADLKQAYQIQFRLTSIDPAILDVESNDTLETALELAPGTVANGFIGNGAAGLADVDMFRVTLGAHQLVSFSGYSYPAHNYSNFTDLRLYDADGQDLTGYLTYWGGYYSETGGTFYAAVTGPVTAYTFSYSLQTLTGITELEPNDSPATAQPIDLALGSTTTRQGFWGDRSDVGDPDLYAVYVPANSMLDVSIQGVPGFITSNSSKLAVLDAEGNVLGTNPAYYLPLQYYSSVGETVYVRFNERADLKQAYRITFALTATGAGLDAPTISPLPNVTTDEEAPTAPISIRISDPDSSSNDVSVTVSSSNQALLPNDGLLLTGNGGEWTLIATPALDQFGLVTITVTATDIDGNSTTNRFTLRVRPVDDAPVAIDLTAAEIPENVPGAVVGTLSSTDPDGATGAFAAPSVFRQARMFAAAPPPLGDSGATYELLFDPTELFEINGDQLQLKPGMVADFEGLESAFLIVRVTDSSGETFEQDFTVDISDLNDAPTVSNGTLELAENGPAITTAILADDIDADDDPTTLSYILVTPPQWGTVQVNGDGTFTYDLGDALPNLPQGITQTDSFTFQVVDSHGVASSTGTVTVTINGINDTPDDIALLSTTISENNAANATVGTLSATDPDAESTFTFSLVDGIGSTDNASFAIVDNALAITATADFETKSSYSIRVQVTDQGGLTFEESFTIDVIDVNESPSITSNQTFSIAENSVAGTPVGFVDASDVDKTAPNNTLTYTIANGNTGDAFAIDSTTGQITVNNSSALDFEVTPQFTLQVKVTDGGSEHLTTTQAVFINTTNLNEPPSITGGRLFISPENSAINTVVGQVIGTDPEVGDTLTYSITGGNVSGAFAIDPSTGAIAVANQAVLDFETKPSFELIVQVADIHGATGTASVMVNLTNVSEPPQLNLNGPAVTWINKQTPVVALPQVTVGGTAALSGGTLSLSVNAIGTTKKLLDQFHIPSFSGLGSSAGPQFANGHLTLQIQLGANATNAAVQSFLHGITFATKGKGLKTTTRTLNVTLASAEGLSANVSQTISVRKKA